MKQRRNLFYEVKRPHRGKALVIGNGSSIQRDDGKGVLDTPLVADACYRDAEKMAEVLGNLDILLGLLSRSANGVSSQRSW
eukprot:TRINITY_DN447_c0_g1_i7.p2 TRINITY_DN447_c0_g1~~TRINITY_DN447_c0_g1_i7.p2  ORF type:complete len:81 (+),score=18.50 TRINITY_DN447_c0_g1_i7:478-720(+)